MIDENKEMVDDAIIRIRDADTDSNLGAGDIAIRVMEELGIEGVSPQKVAAVLRESKKLVEVENAK